MQLSIVIPLLNEAESLVELYNSLKKVVLSEKFSHEIIFIDDGSVDNSWKIIQSISKEDTTVKGFRFSQNFGKSQALHLGFSHSKGNVVITMDADLQDDPLEIPELYELITNNNCDLVSGWKRVRYDNYWTKNLPSKLFNWAARKTSGIYLHDFNCGLKAYKNEVIKNVNVTGEMHRYIPILAKNAGFKNIKEKEVRHHPRKYGSTKFGKGRFIKGFLDLLTIWFVSRFGKTPMHFFGTAGLLMFFIGACLTLYLAINKLFINTTDRLLTSRSEFYLALFIMSIGIQFFLAGFLGELILNTKPSKKNYIISEKIND